jgi:hypothetical protein
MLWEAREADATSDELIAVAEGIYCYPSEG